MSHHGCPERLSNMAKGFTEEGGSQATMEVLVETLTGTAFEMTVSPSDTIFAIKSKIFRVEGIPVSQQHLLYNLKELDDASSLHELSICDGARLRLVLGMRGGPISSRRLPPPPNAEPWRDIERLLDTGREDGEWSSGGSAGGSGCKVTVLVFRDGERVNMLRVRENHDGTYSPIDTAKYSSVTSEGEAGGGREEARTRRKMCDLRRRMERLALRHHGEVSDIQKTRSEETLSVASMASAVEEVPCVRVPCALPPLPRAASSRSVAAPPLAPSHNHNHIESGLWRALSASSPALGTSAAAAPGEERLQAQTQAAAVATAAEAQTVAAAVKRPRCGWCRKRLGAATLHRCRCGGQYCAPHRYAEVHGCRYDYKAEARPLLRRDNPLVSAPKLPKI